MTEGKTTTKNKSQAANKSQAEGFTAEERAAMKARAQEVKAEARASKNRAEGEATVVAAIAEMPDADRVLAERLHELITASAPDLLPKTWYGMPAYANHEGKVVCFFQAASKFNARYATLGFNDSAHLDDGALWPVAFALKEWTGAAESRIRALVQQAVA